MWVAALALWSIAASQAGPPPATFVADGWTYAVSDAGAVAGRYKAGGTWSEIDARHAAGAEARAQAPTWRVKVVVYQRSDRRFEGKPTRLVRTILSPEQVADALDELKLFARAAEALADGHLRVEIVPILSESTLRGSGFFDANDNVLERVIGPNVNSVVFDPDEPFDRGPFDSAFVLFPGAGSAEGWFHGTAASGISIDGRGAPGQIAEEMVGRWTEHLRQRAQDLGFPVREGLSAPQAWVPGGLVTLRTPDDFMAPELWDAIGKRTATTTEYIEHTRAQPAEARPQWEDVRANPYRLPYLDAPAAKTLMGDASTLRSAWTGGVDAILEPGESVSQKRFGARRLLYVRWPMADLFGSHLAPEHDARPVGWAIESGVRCVVFDALGEDAAQPEINLLRLEGCTVQLPPQLRGKPSILRARPEPATAVYRDGTPFTMVDLDARGPRLIRLTWKNAQGAERSRWAAWTVADPVEVVAPRALVVGSKTLEVPVRFARVDAPVRVRWETPPGWSAPTSDVARDGEVKFPLDAPEGPLSQEIRCIVEGPDGWSRRIPIQVVRRNTPVALSVGFEGAGMPRAEGTVAVARVADPEVGPVLQLADPPGSRSGSVDLLKMAGGQPLFDVDTHPYFSIKVLAKDAEPYDLCFQSDRPVVVRIADVAGAYGVDRYAASVAGPWDKWRTVVVDLRKLGLKGSVTRVWLQTPPAALFNERLRYDATLQVANISVSTEGAADAWVNEVGNVGSPDGPVWQRALWAAQNPSPAALGAGELPVAYAAAAALRGIRSPECVPLLGELLRNLDSGLVLEAARALAFQDTPEAWALLRAALDTGPSFEAKWGAAEAFRKRPDPGIAALLTAMLIAPEPEARATGAEALAQIKGPNPAQMLLVFLQDVDPWVRQVVARVADMDDETSARRVQYESVNDPSDAVRAESYLALTRSNLIGLREEGLKGVRDDSPSVRLHLLRAFAQLSDPKFAQAYALAIADIDPRVRAAALRGYRSLPGTVTDKELGGVWEEVDPRVQRALVELVDAKSLAVSEAALGVLRNSVDPQIAQWARNRSK